MSVGSIAPGRSWIRRDREADYTATVDRPWRKTRYKWERAGLSLAAAIVPLFGRRFCYYFANLAGYLFAHLDRAGRAVALNNLEVAFGERFTLRERQSITDRSYQNITRTLIDLLWTPRITPANFHRWLEVEGLEEAFADIPPGTSCIIPTIHYGNFEWAAKGLGFSGVPMVIVAQELKNSGLDPIIAALRTHSGHTMVGRERGIIRMFKALKRGEHAGFLSDLTLRPMQPSVAIECFGMKYCVTFAHAWLHLKTGAPIVPVYGQPLPGGRCRLVVQRKLEIPPGATETEITQLCWDRFEEVIRRDPAPWLWMYKQWRYRPTPTLRPYPFYSNDSEEFDALIARNEPAPLTAVK